MTQRTDFEAIFDQSDPWGLEALWYEARKRDVLMAALPEARYTCALEAGCATGMLTERLATRCDALLAVDLVQRAVDRTRQRVVACPWVKVRQATLPEDWPAGTFDLVVLSELGYFFSPEDWRLVADRAAGALGSQGTIVACHWLRPFAERQMPTRHVHAAIARRHGLHRHVRHIEPDFLLEVWSRNATSIRMREAVQ